MTGLPAQTQPLVLVIEDEAPIRKFLRASLTAHGYRVNEAATGEEGVRQAAMQPPDLIILDLGLPDMDGLEVARQVRGWSAIPVLVLSARGQEQDKINALDAGADDYLTKPFGVGELMARLRVAMRHAQRKDGAPADPVHECTRDGRTLRVDLARRRVTLTDTQGEHEVRFTPTEFKMLAVLAKYAGRVLTHKQLLTEVWGPRHDADVQYLRVYAGQLRQKLEANPAQPAFLITEPGVGYRLSE